MLPKVGRFGDLRRRILSWWRSARISISSEARPEQSDQPAPDQFAEVDHRAEASPDSLLSASRIRFATGTVRYAHLVGLSRKNPYAKNRERTGPEQRIFRTDQGLRHGSFGFLRLVFWGTAPILRLCVPNPHHPRPIILKISEVTSSAGCRPSMLRRIVLTR